MKRHLIYFFLLLIAQAGYAQTGSKNYVLQRNFKQAGAAVNDVSKVNIQVNYLDGLGRPLQTVVVGQSTAGTDIITPVEYDAYDRQLKTYLPYAGGGNGAFQSGAVGSQAGFYTANTPQLDGSDLARPYTESTLENAPSSRPLAGRAPGNKSASAAMAYGANNGSEVKLYTYTPNADITQTISSTVGTYPAGRLYKSQTTDENDKINVDFTDIEGRLICRKSGSEALATYYVYDELSRLRAVLQPKYQDNVSAATLAFLYEYDDRGRMTGKNVPGAGKTEMVYDNFDRMVLSRDAGQQVRGVWGFFKYDVLSRRVLSGEYTSGATRAAQQAALNASGAHHEDKNGSTVGYTLSNTLPSVSENDVLTVAYFDDYSFSGSQAYVNVLSVSNNSAVKLHQTGSRTRMLATGSAWLIATTHYDSEYRPIQRIRQLYDLGGIGIERVSTKYKFDLAPVVDQERTDHESSGAVTNSLLKTFTYDHADRLLSVKEKVTIGAITPMEAVTLAQRYNILGQLKSKWLYSDDAIKFRKRTDFTSNIRGWNTLGKTVYKAAESGGDVPFFGYGLDYANGPNYTNGNISAMSWSDIGNTSYIKGLTFTYDGVNRLTGSAGVYGNTNIESGITYDKNGNILTLTRAGVMADNLTYAYGGSDNRLTGVNDASGNNTGVKAGSSAYGYDANGNITSDGNKVAVLTYNYLNLVKTVVTGGNTLTYDFDAAGTKHKYSSTALTVKYAGPFEYDQTNAVKRVSLAEGQAVFRASVLHFDSYVKDHLGNVRVVFDELGSTIQRTDFYPFGAEIPQDVPVQTPAARNLANRYNFLGKETQIATGYIDLQARFYDPTIGRFLQIDPETEGQDNLSPYHYSFDNPIRFSDPDGREPECCKGVGDFVTGALQAFTEDFTGAASPIKATPGYVSAYNTGRTAGHYAAQAAAALEIVGGVAGDAGAVVGEIGSVGLATPAAAGLVAVSTAGIIHGAGVAAKAAANLENDKGKVNTSSIDNQASVNGNSKTSTKEQHNYDVKDAQTGKTVKTGVSGGKETKAGTSYRGTSQANKWNKQEGTPGRYKSEITNRVPAGQGARQKALNYEEARAKELRKELDPVKHNRP